MRKFLVLFLFFMNFVLAKSAYAQEGPLPEQLMPHDAYYKAIVNQITKEAIGQSDGVKTLSQTANITFLEGNIQGKSMSIERSGDTRLMSSEKLSPGLTVIVDVTTQPGQPTRYTITDIYRLTYLWYIAAAFFVCIIIVAGWKGFSALGGLIVSLVVIMGGIVPAILHHADPLAACLIGAFVILVTTTFIAHGFSKGTTIAVTSTFLSLIMALLFAMFAVHLAHMAGLGTEDSYMLELSPNQQINPSGLLLGGIIIGALGALNDITTTQVAALYALRRTNPAVSVLHLIEQGFLIGREHIVSLVNTLVLAYAGSSLVIFIFFGLNPAHLPWWVIVNNETVSEEIIRSIAGSFGLILAIPITTLLAAWLVSKDQQAKNEPLAHAH